jgi:CheY-like chemotaxis protein
VTAPRLLVVHPEPKVSGDVRRVAERLGYEVSSVPDGERAIDRFILRPFDVVVVEYFLPGRDGVTTVESIRWAPMGRQMRAVLLAESEPEIAPVAALGARIDAIETIVGTPSEPALERALLLARQSPSGVPVTPEPASFEDETGRGPAPDPTRSPEAVPSKTMATRFDDESTVQGSAGVARAMLGPWAPGLAPPGIDGLPKARSKGLDSFPEAAPLRGITGLSSATDRDASEATTGRRPSPPAGEWRRDRGALDEARAVQNEAERDGASVSSGRFEATPFPEVLVRLAEAKVTGALVCKQEALAPQARETTTGDPPTKVVYLRAGVPTHIRSNLLDECLGQLLLRKKRIGRATLEESIRRTLAGDGLQGEILIDMGALSPIEVSETLATQATEKLYDLFGWRRGAWRVLEGAGKEGGLPIEQGLADTIYEGVCAAMPATQLLDLLTPHLDAYVVPDAQRLARFARVRLPAELRPVLARIDGGASLRRLLAAGGRPGAVAQMVYALHCLGAVRFAASPNARGPGRDPDDSAVSPTPANDRPPPALDAVRPGTGASWDEDVTAKQGKRAPHEESSSSVEVPTAPREAAPVHRVPESVLRKMAEPSEPRSAPGLPASGATARAPELDQKVDRLFEAERHFRRGSRALERQRHEDALSAFVRAHELVPIEGEFLAYVGWSRFCLAAAQGGDPGEQELALTELAQAADLSPDLYVTHLLYARVLSRLRRDGEARRAYERALLLEPDNAEAKAALSR